MYETLGLLGIKTREPSEAISTSLLLVVISNKVLDLPEFQTLRYKLSADQVGWLGIWSGGVINSVNGASVLARSNTLRPETSDEPKIMARSWRFGESDSSKTGDFTSSNRDFLGPSGVKLMSQS